MANEDRKIPDILKDLEDHAHLYDFFAALRLIETQKEDGVRLGENRSPRSDDVFFGQKVSLSFAPSTIAELRRNTNNPSEVWIDNYFFGLMGPNGPLPKHLTELFISEVMGNKRPQFLDFLNLFNHRLITLFYRAWANKEPTTLNDSPSNNKYKLYLGALSGYAEPDLHDRDQMSDYVKFRYTRFLSGKTRYPEGITRMLSDMFNLTARVDNFAGEWIKIPEDGLCKIESGPYGRRLGLNTTQGRYSWACQYKFRVLLGPMTIDEFEQLLPTQKRASQVNDIIRNYVGIEYQWDIVLLLKKEEIPNLELTKNQYKQLGWTTWLKSNSDDNDGHVADIHINSEQFKVK